MWKGNIRIEILRLIWSYLELKLIFLNLEMAYN